MVAEAAYSVKVAIGAEDAARGNLATALGTSPLRPVSVQSMDQISTPEEIELSLDQAIDRALQQRPDLLKEVAEIRSADARVKEAKSAYFLLFACMVIPTFDRSMECSGRSLGATPQMSMAKSISVWAGRYSTEVPESILGRRPNTTCKRRGQRRWIAFRKQRVSTPMKYRRRQLPSVAAL